MAKRKFSPKQLSKLLAISKSKALSKKISKVSPKRNKVTKEYMNWDFVKQYINRNKKYIEKTTKYTGEAITKLTKRDWEEVKQIPDMARKTFLRIKDIATGKVYAEVSDIAITNYSEGLRQAGYKTLADKFEAYARYLKDKSSEEFEMFMENDMPDLYLFYKDKGRSHVKRQKAYNQETADELIDYISEILDEKFDWLPDSDKEALEKQINKNNEDSAKG